MVRKRPQAQKGLSPEKKVRREDSTNGTIKQANKESTSAGKEKKELLNGISEEKIKINHPKETVKPDNKSQTNQPEKSVKIDNESKQVDKQEKEEEPKEQQEQQLQEDEQLDENFQEEISTFEKNEAPETLPDYINLKKPLSEKAKSYWNAVMNDYSDFTNWTCLLQTVTETEDNLEAARLTYSCFLRYFPLCYGYWKKFADLEKKAGNFDTAEKVFQQGVEAIPISIDLWVHYINFTIQQNKDKPNKEQRIRDLFEDAIQAAGIEFRSNKLWDAYIEWEKSQGNLKHVTEIYDRLIALPTLNSLKNWQRFKKHLSSNPPIDVLPTEEYSKVMQGVDAIPPGMTADDLDPTIITTAPPGEGEVTNVTIAHNEEMEDDEEKEKAHMERVRLKIIADRERVFRKTAEKVNKRWPYEDSIKRPYFHLKPLEKAQLKNWKEYLDFEMGEGNHKRICFLFERCVVACALYEDMWEKYLDYIENRNVEVARSVFWRACKIHLMKKFKIHLRWAVFEEKHSNYELAADILATIDKNYPGLILITQRRVGVARRMKKYDDIMEIYETAIALSDKIEMKIFYMIKYSHALVKFLQNKSKARDVLWDALKLGKKQKRVYLQILDLELHYGEIETLPILKLFDAVENDRNLSEEFQDMFAQRKVEFFEEYGINIEMILDIKDAYQKQYKKQEANKNKSSENKEKKTAKLYNRTEHTDVTQNILGQEQPVVAQNFSNLVQAGNPWPEAGNFDWNAYANYYQFNQQPL